MHFTKILILGLTLFCSNSLLAQQGTVNDPIPSDESLQASGGQDRDEKYWSLLPSNRQVKLGIAHFSLTYDTYSIPDSIDVYYQGVNIYSTNGLVSEAKSVDLSIALSSSSLIQVIFNQNGNPEPDTEWVYSVESRIVELIDENDESDVTEGSTAYITPDSPPLRPKLQAQVRNAQVGSTVQWKLKVIYDGEEIDIPANGEFTKSMPADQPWYIFNAYVDANNKDLGFFGGKATLTYKLDSEPEDTIKFTVGGKNPEDSICRGYIDSLASGSAIAYPVAKHETLNQCGKPSFYNQFYDENSKLSKNDAVRKVGFPVVAPDNGFGIYQITNGPAATRDQKWNWQSNVIEGVRRLVTTSTSTTFPTALDKSNKLISDLFRTYPNAEDLPNVEGIFKGVRHSFSGADAATLIGYNGFGGCPTIMVLKKNGRMGTRSSCWTYESQMPAGKRWIFHPNSENYVQKVLKQVE